MCYGTKDRSWGVRPVGAPVAGRARQRRCRRSSSCGRRSIGTTAARTSCASSVRTATAGSAARRCSTSSAATIRCSVPTPTRAIHHLAGDDARSPVGAGAAPFARARRCACSATTEREERIELEPLLTFRMRGLGYMHPEWGHGHWHGELAVGSEEHKVEELDNVEPWNIHIQQVMRARWGDKVGLGVLEQLAFGDHHPSGLTGILDGYK